jgi:hypothetical protein
MRADAARHLRGPEIDFFKRLRRLASEEAGLFGAYFTITGADREISIRNTSGVRCLSQRPRTPRR